MNIGSNIRQLRMQRGLTQDLIAAKLGVSSQAVSKWETGANTPDIALLPEISSVFCVSIDALFSDNITDYSDIYPFMKDDGVIRVVQIQGTKVLNVTSVFSADDPPIEIAFPRNCNEKTQYFKVEVFGHVIADGSINGDVVCHQTIHCSTINGDVKSEGDIKVNELNGQKIVCNNITDCYKLQAKNIVCSGPINAMSLTSDQIVYKNE